MTVAVVLLAAATSWFQAVQYTPRTVALRGCAECRGEPDDLCEVRAGAQVQPIQDYAAQRWAGPARLKLLRPSAEAQCAVAAAALSGPRAQVELAAVRFAPSAPSAALLDGIHLRKGIHSWPRRPQRRSAEVLVSAHPDRNLLRAAVVCWASEHGWPAPAAAGSDARSAPDAANTCEWWLLAVQASGEPDLSGVSFAIAEPAFAAGAARWAGAFDPALALDEALLSGEPAPHPAAPVAAAVPPPAPPAARVRCGDAARERTATLDRFDQWDLQIRGAARPSLDRGSFTLTSAAWSGHCQELEVLQAALESQLECAVAVEGRCVAAGGR